MATSAATGSGSELGHPSFNARVRGATSQRPLAMQQAAMELLERGPLAVAETLQRRRIAAGSRSPSVHRQLATIWALNRPHG